MARWLSYEHAVNNIRLLYQHAGFDVGTATPGQAVAREFMIDVRNVRLGALYAFVDEAILLLRYVSYWFSSAMGAGDPKAATFYRLSVQMLATLASIRALCSLGFDANARMQLRLLYETAILWCRFMLDHEARAAFEVCRTPEASNRFWHQYIAKGKSERFIRTKVATLNLSWLGNYGDGSLLDDAQMRMGLSAHPSHLAVVFDTLDDWEDPAQDKIAVRSPRVSSHFTLATSLFIAALPFSLLPEPNYGLTTVDLREGGPWPPANSKATSWDDYNRLIRQMIGMLFLGSINFSNRLRSGDKGGERKLQA